MVRGHDLTRWVRACLLAQRSFQRCAHPTTHARREADLILSPQVHGLRQKRYFLPPVPVAGSNLQGFAETPALLQRERVLRQRPYENPRQ